MSSKMTLDEIIEYVDGEMTKMEIIKNKNSKYKMERVKEQIKEIIRVYFEYIFIKNNYPVIM